MTEGGELQRLREENAHLRALLEQSTSNHKSASHGVVDAKESHKSSACERAMNDGDGTQPLGWEGNGHKLTKEQVARYSRQIILPSFGAQGLSSTIHNMLLVGLITT